MSSPFLAEITMFGGNFAPRGWAFCDGQLLSIAQNSALFSILGTTYGGDGRTTFGLPDLRGRAPMQQGNGPGLSNIRLGQKLGAENVTLNATHIPSHNHTMPANTSTGNKDTPSSAVPAGYGTSVPPDGPYATGQAPNVSLHSSSVTNTGGNQAFNIRQPSLCVNFIIAIQGIFPSRS